ncbi:MAG: hypothetical protein COU40_00080 [Candidatus Moranbacteria bacterium CG10_big_fil_rev_8_21_14_0_10_35_21]|nr:MAG: hypothetical protein COU40_00080 [Candidatus Moranbacteria bacterium CG10_big_fil_rev_8_21_14_0_10_35_21]PJA88455.1 MAG: hypothetical protein CO139_03045 [Candidatus Moranbacteria bacterium CG_4_9_14_3_um_filter_36_9]
MFNDLNIKRQAEELGVSVWRAPSFLFLVMGVIIIFAMTAIYYFSKKYDSPEVVVIAESLVVSIIFIIGNSIIKLMDQMAKLNKMKTEFISVASHQLRTPLTAIKWETELLLSKSKDLPAKPRGGIENINILSTRMNDLVNDLLNVARIDQKILILEKETVDLGKITENSIKNFLFLAGKKGIEIEFQKNPSLPEFISDREKLKTIVENLLSNSLKYTPDKGKIVIKIENDEQEIIFSIRDNGVGIPSNQQAQIFTKFFRSDNAVKYQTGGTGLGLFIAKEIINKMNGKIWFESEENKGTIFTFSLPITN